MEITIENILGNDLRVFRYESCIMQVGEGDNWATIYFMESKEKGKGHGTHLLNIAKIYYQWRKLRFGSSVALSPAMRHLLQKLQIHEYA